MVRISGIQFLFLRLMLEISCCKANASKFEIIWLELNVYGDEMIGIEAARNSPCWIFFIREAAGNGTCTLEKVRNLH